jgi:hypothetical protein
MWTPFIFTISAPVMSYVVVDFPAPVFARNMIRAEIFSKFGIYESDAFKRKKNC